jgi:hypothetical protein
MTWADRMDELATYQPEGMAWNDLWALLVKGENHNGIIWLKSLLWRYKLARWVLHIGRNGCRTCGAKISNETQGNLRYCSTACRKVAHRRRSKGEETPFGERTRQAEGVLREVSREIDDSQRWLRRQIKLDKALVPPDFTQLEHVPYIPARCGSGCGSGVSCGHTGSICLFACTAKALEDSDG